MPSRQPRVPVHQKFSFDASDDDLSSAPREPAKKPAATKPAAAKPTVAAPATKPAAPAAPAETKKKPAAKAKQPTLRQWNAEHRTQSLDGFMRGIVADNQKKYGSESVHIAGESQSLMIGIPCPFVMEYLIGHSAWPLGLVAQYVGQRGAGKSALLFNTFEWFLEAGGLGNLEEAESKHSDSLIKELASIPNGLALIGVNRCDAVEEWQQRLLNDLNSHKERMTWENRPKKIKGPGPIIPVCFGVDSVSGKLAMASQEKINEQGHGSPAFALEANIIGRFLKTAPQQLNGWPFSVVLVNHLKMGKDDMGHDKRNIPGGAQIGFQETLEIEVQNGRTLNTENFEGNDKWLRCAKNSIGPDNRKAMVRYLWRQALNPETGKFDKKTWWDWGHAAVKLITGGLSPMWKKCLTDSDFHLASTADSPVKNAAWSRNLGMKSEDAEPYDEVWKKIKADAKLMTTLRAALGIQEMPLLTGNYREQLETLRAPLR